MSSGILILFINAFLKTTVRNNVSVLVLRKALVDTRATGCKTQQLSILFMLISAYENLFCFL
jgi:hypothetical protein